MADPSTNWIDFWISLSGVAETAIWAGLVGTLVVRFRKPIEKVVTSISSRVEKGDNVDFFGLKLETVKEAAKFEAALEVSVRDVVSELTSTRSDTKNLSEEIIRRVREQHFLSIDFSNVIQTKPTIRSVPYSQFESIGLLLKYIWFEAGIFRRSSYNIEWIIKNERTGEFLGEIGSKFARQHDGTHWDERPLEKIDIRVGDIVSVHRKSGSIKDD